MGNKTPKITDAKTALSVIKDGMTIGIGHATGEPQHLTAALHELNGKVKDVRTTHMVDMGKSMYCAPESVGSFRHCSLFVGGLTRKAVNEGRADMIPVHFSRIPELFWADFIEVDVALIQVSPPDNHGFVSLGCSVDYDYAISQKAKIVIAQVNKHMPRTHGQSFIPVSDLDYIVEYDEPLIELLPGELTPEDIKIGQYCGELIEDGATLQLGIGALPDAVLAALTDKKDLGIHTEMFSDGVMNLVNKGVINNSKKTLHKGKMVATFIMGSKALYDFIDDNPMVYMAPSDYTNDPYVIAQNDNMVSINSCIEIDLSGQVCSESVGLRQISATGGQVDYIRGTNMSKNGKAIIAVASATKDGKRSKIVPFLEQGATVTTLRNDVSYIITENGIAYLKGKTLKERGRELIKIAHPNFQDELKAEWERRFKDKF